MNSKTRRIVTYSIETPYPWPAPHLTVEVPDGTTMETAVAAGQHLRSALCDLWDVERRGISIHAVVSDVTTDSVDEGMVPQQVGGR